MLNVLNARIIAPTMPLLYIQWLAMHSSVLVTGLFLSNENTIGPAIDLLALVLREASRDR